jgi:hypothetical protein
MPTPTIPAGNLFMNATLYTGTGATQTITNGVAGQSFQPDFVWGKVRSTTEDNILYDSLRGAGYILSSNTTAAEINNVGFNLTSFNSNGFSLASGNQINQSGQTNVAWQWKAGGAAVTNTAGTISSQVSANTTSGFSVVTYTHNGTNAATVGHGLGVTPSFIINKQRSAAASWRCYHVSLSAGYNIQLNLNQAQSVAGDIFQTAPTSSVFTPGNGDSASGQTMVAYCWAPIAGYSAFGSYVGNGVADGPFIYTGFRPRYYILKNITNAQSWSVQDTSRSPYNVGSAVLLPNSSSAELTGTDFVDILSNGFKIRHSSSGNNNNSGDTYVYACWAENPFKYANAR